MNRGIELKSLVKHSKSVKSKMIEGSDIYNI